MKTQKIAKSLKSSAPYMLGLAVLVILFFMMAEFMTAALLFAAAVLVAFFVGILNLRMTGIELTTLATVTYGMAFGSSTGAILGTILIILHLIFGKYINVYVLWVIPAYALAGVVAGMFTASSIASVGVLITIGLHVIFFLFTAIITPQALVRHLPYAILNIIINWFLFRSIAPYLLSAMA